MNDVKVIPRCFSLLPLKRFYWVIAGFDEGPIYLFDHYSVRLENCPLVLARKIHRKAFLLRLGGEHDALEKVTFAFQIPNAPGDGGNDLDGRYLVPSFEPTMRVYR